MKILTGRHIKEADAITIAREPISGLDLMERASEAIARRLCALYPGTQDFLFLIGKGNNGGDGLAAARLLSVAGRRCNVLLTCNAKEMTAECRANLGRLPREVVRIEGIPADYSHAGGMSGRSRISEAAGNDRAIGAGSATEAAGCSGGMHTGFYTDILTQYTGAQTVVVDALLGTGCEGGLREPLASLARALEAVRPLEVVAIDLPSGIPSEFTNVFAFVNTPAGVSVRADRTLTLQFPKLSLLLPESGREGGRMEVLDIGLDALYMAEAESVYEYADRDFVRSLAAYRPSRTEFGHKGDFGHALLICGSRSMPGAALLAAGGALRSGCGLVTAHIPECLSTAMAVGWPSAIQELDRADCFSLVPGGLDKYRAVGIGCGLGQDLQSVTALGALLEKVATTASSDIVREVTNVNTNVTTPCILLDADALNIVAAKREYLKKLPPLSIVTPHVGELKRLVGDWKSEEEKLQKVDELAREYSLIVVLKGAHTMIVSPDGRKIFNSTGTPGMAKGGSGDVLAGLITGLVARGYPAFEASVTGVYIQGLAGEIAARRYGAEAMNSADIIECIGGAMLETFGKEIA